MPRLSLFKNILFLLFLLFLSVASCHCNFSFYSFKPMNFVGFQSLVSLPFLATFIVFLWWFLPASGCLFPSLVSWQLLIVFCSSFQRFVLLPVQLLVTLSFLATFHSILFQLDWCWLTVAGYFSFPWNFYSIRVQLIICAWCQLLLALPLLATFIVYLFCFSWWYVLASCRWLPPPLPCILSLYFVAADDLCWLPVARCSSFPRNFSPSGRNYVTVTLSHTVYFFFQNWSISIISLTWWSKSTLT